MSYQPIQNADLTSLAQTITTQNLVPAGVATASSAAAITGLNGHAAVAVQVTGTYTGALSAQGQIDGSTWVTLGGTPFLNVATGTYSATIASASVGMWQLDVAGFTAFRITALAAVTGTATVSIRASAGIGLVGIDAPLPSGSNAIGSVSVSNFAVGTFGNSDGMSAGLTSGMNFSEAFMFNGTTWDRARLNWNTTTGDTGAKTTTFNGATQTNYNATGATILINMGTVSGTTPTLTAQLQGSADSGTTWYNVPGAVTPSITATGTTVLAVYPGVTPVANAAVSYPLPRTWRLVYTIGGTTPSFTITNVQVAYTL